MKHLKFLSAVVLFSLTALFQSCDDNDGYSIGDIGRDLVTVHMVGNNTYSFTGDTWGSMWPAAPAFINYRPVEGERAILYFNPLYDDFEGYDVAIKVENIQPILTKTVEELTAENEADYGNDPARISDVWISGGYMNLIFHQHLPEKSKHRVSLVENTSEEHENDDYIHLEYRYNTYGDTLRPAMVRSMVCYNLNTLDMENKKGIKLKINSAVSGERVLTFESTSQQAPENVKELELSDKYTK